MKKRLIRVLSGLMSVVLALSMFVFSPELIARADDVTDYNIACYTPTIDFGTISKGDYVDERQFSIVNTGSTDVELDYFENDVDDAFVVYFPVFSYMHPGDQLAFDVEPEDDLEPGNYRATYTFFNPNDPNYTHTATVTFILNVKDNSPYVNKVTVSPGSANSPAGKQLQFSAGVSGGNNPSTEVAWAVNGQQSASTSIDSTGKLTIGADEKASAIMVTATSRQTPTVYDSVIVTITQADHLVSVSANPKEGGNVSGGGSFKDGSNVTLYQSANNNYRFTGWYEKGSQISTANQLVLSGVNSDRAVEARFERVSCVVVTKVNNAAGGTVTGGGKVNYNGSVTLKATANPGYAFEGFVENNKVISTSPTLQINNITTEREIMASFKQTKFNVSAVVYPANSGKVSGEGQYDLGKNATLTATAATGFDFVNWSIDGKVVSDQKSYTVSNITKNVNVVANFAKHNTKYYKISSEDSNGGVIVPSGVNQFAEGSKVTYNITAKSGYKIASVIVDGKDVGTRSSYTFSDIQGDHKISATFKKDDGRNEEKQGNDAADHDNGWGQEREYEPVIEENVTERGVMSQLGVSEENARKLIQTGGDLPLLKAAFENGYLRVTVNSSYANVEQETSEALYYEDPSLKNFEQIVQACLTEEEKIAALNGDVINFNINIWRNPESIAKSAKKAFQDKVGYKPVSYFDFTILKTIDEETTMIEETPVELETTLRLSDNLKRGRKYCVLRYHNGQVDILEDMDDDPDTVTFKTDKFSQYAIAYKAVNMNVLILVMIILTVLSMIVGFLCISQLIYEARRKRRAQRTGRRE